MLYNASYLIIREIYRVIVIFSKQFDNVIETYNINLYNITLSL